MRSLQVFEAIGRLGSVASAASELGITSGAVSQQLHALEVQLGVRLFRKEGRRLRMTDEAHDYFEIVAEGFERLRDASRVLKRARQRSRLVVSALPSFAMKWLAPRLFAWQQVNPSADVRLESTHHEGGLAEDGIDFRITYGYRATLHPHAQELFRDEAVPVCAPAFLKRHGPFGDAHAIARSRLIEIDWRPDHANGITWKAWFDQAGLHEPKLDTGPAYVLSGLAIEAAIAGAGIVLGQRSFIASDMAAGRLVQVHALAAPMSEAYFVAWPETAIGKPAGRELLAWILLETSENRRLQPPLQGAADPAKRLD